MKLNTNFKSPMVKFVRN